MYQRKKNKTTQFFMICFVLILLIELSLAQKTCQTICLQTENSEKCTVCYEHCLNTSEGFQKIVLHSCQKCKDPICEDKQIYEIESTCFQSCFEKQKTWNENIQKTRICQQDPQADYKWGIVGAIIFVVVVVGGILGYCLFKRIQIWYRQNKQQKQQKNQKQAQYSNKNLSTQNSQPNKPVSTKKIISTHKIIC